MTSQIWSNIFTLLSATVLADGRVFEEEIDALVTTMNRLQKKTGLASTLTRDDVETCFAQNRDRIFALVSQETMAAEVIKHFTALNDFPQKQTLLDCMQDIAISDNHVHDSEFDIVILASAFWGIMPKKFQKTDDILQPDTPENRRYDTYQAIQDNLGTLISDVLD